KDKGPPSGEGSAFGMLDRAGGPPMMRWSWLAVPALLLAGCSCQHEDPPPMPRDGGVGDACVGDTQCRAGLTCAEDDTCQPTGTTEEGAACMLSAECAQHLYCGASRTCEAAGAGEDGADCEHTADCTAGLL